MRLYNRTLYVIFLDIKFYCLC